MPKPRRARGERSASDMLPDARPDRRRIATLTPVRYLWALPASVIGLLPALIAIASGARARRVDGVLEVAGGRLPVWLQRLPGRLSISAITFGHVVLARDCECMARCRRHERIHVQQYERWGALFFPLYLGSSAWQLLRGRDPYWHNHFELEAYRKDSTPPEG